MPHGGLHLVDVKGGVSVHHHFHVFVVVGEPRDADVLEVSVGDVFSHSLGPDAKKTFLVEIIVRVLSGLHRRVHELLHGGTNDFVGNLVVGVAEFLEGRLPVAADLVVVLVLLDTKGRGWLDKKEDHDVEVFVSPVVLRNVAGVSWPRCFFQ